MCVFKTNRHSVNLEKWQKMVSWHSLAMSSSPSWMDVISLGVHLCGVVDVWAACPVFQVVRTLGTFVVPSMSCGRGSMCVSGAGYLDKQLIWQQLDNMHT